MKLFAVMDYKNIVAIFRTEKKAIEYRRKHNGEQALTSVPLSLRKSYPLLRVVVLDSARKASFIFSQQSEEYNYLKKKIDYFLQMEIHMEEPKTRKTKTNIPIEEEKDFLTQRENKITDLQIKQI